MDAYVLLNGELQIEDSTFWQIPVKLEPMYPNLFDNSFKDNGLNRRRSLYTGFHPNFVLMSILFGKHTAYEVFFNGNGMRVRQLTEDYLFEIELWEQEFITYYSRSDNCYKTQSIIDSSYAFGDTTEEAENNFLALSK